MARNHIFVLSVLRGSAFSFSLLNMMLAVGLPYMAFIMLRYVPSKPILLESLSKIDVEFFVSVEMTVWFSFFSLLLWYIYHIDLQIPVINPTWLEYIILFLGYIILLMYYWFQFANILLRIFTSVFLSDIGL